MEQLAAQIECGGDVRDEDDLVTPSESRSQLRQEIEQTQQAPLPSQMARPYQIGAAAVDLTSEAVALVAGQVLPADDRAGLV